MSKRTPVILTEEVRTPVYSGGARFNEVTLPAGEHAELFIESKVTVGQDVFYTACHFEDRLRYYLPVHAVANV